MNSMANVWIAVAAIRYSRRRDGMLRVVIRLEAHWKKSCRFCVETGRLFVVECWERKMEMMGLFVQEGS